MKKLCFVLFAILVLTSCTPPVHPDPGSHVVFVKNSAWTNIDPNALKSVSQARDMTVTDAEFAAIEANIAAYNLAHTDDQYMLLGEDVPIEQAPDATVYIVRDDTYAVMYTGVFPREDVLARREIWKLTTQNIADPETQQNIPCTLFVDRVPELPPIPPPVDPYVKWAVYLVQGDGSINLEDHLSTQADFDMRYSAFVLTAFLQNRDFPEQGPWVVVAGQLYIPPQ